MNEPTTGKTGRLTMRRLLPAMTVGVLGLAALAASPASAKSATPFGSDVAGTVTSTGSSTYALTASGNSKHLGKTSYAGAVAVTSIDPITGTLYDTLTETLTAANGDTVTILCVQVSVLVAPGVYHGTDEWTVIGGTGRFAGATGSGTGTTEVDLNAGTFSKTSSGTISKGP